MTPEQEALGRRAVACPGWRWMRGCPWERLPSGAPDDGGDRGEANWKHDPPFGALPDLSEPAGVGCLVALAREALEDPGAYACVHQHGWSVQTEMGYHVLYPDGRFDDWTWGDAIVEPSEPAVWVAALEAAGRKDASRI